MEVEEKVCDQDGKTRPTMWREREKEGERARAREEELQATGAHLRMMGGERQFLTLQTMITPAMLTARRGTVRLADTCTGAWLEPTGCDGSGAGASARVL
jgi:hypothetical protein